MKSCHIYICIIHFFKLNTSICLNNSSVWRELTQPDELLHLTDKQETQPQWGSSWLKKRKRLVSFKKVIQNRVRQKMLIVPGQLSETWRMYKQNKRSVKQEHMKRQKKMSKCKCQGNGTWKIKNIHEWKKERKNKL